MSAICGKPRGGCDWPHCDCPNMEFPSKREMRPSSSDQPVNAAPQGIGTGSFSPSPLAEIPGSLARPAVAAPSSPSEKDSESPERQLLREALDEFAHLQEYWNGSSNESAMLDACQHTVLEARCWHHRIETLLSQSVAAQSASGALPEKTRWVLQGEYGEWITNAAYTLEEVRVRRKGKPIARYIEPEPYRIPLASTARREGEERLCSICKYPERDPRCEHWGPK